MVYTFLENQARPVCCVLPFIRIVSVHQSENGLTCKIYINLVFSLFLKEIVKLQLEPLPFQHIGAID